MHARIENNQVVEYPIVNLRQHLPNTSLHADLTDNSKLPAGYVYVVPGDIPPHNPATHKAIQATTPSLVHGRWVLAYSVTQLDAEELAELAAQKLQAAKDQRNVQVENIEVTTPSGNTFDGDETAQTRMARAIVALSPSETTLWVLANNTPAMVSREELQEALRLAGAAQTAIWMTPYGS